MATTTTPKASGFKGALDRYFLITERGSSFSQEIRGGLVTFFAMSYIIVLNPIILRGIPDGSGALLGGEGFDGFARVAAATALAAGLLTIAMGVFAKFPIAIAAGLGLNAFLLYSVASLEGMTWADAMGLIVLEGIIILILVLTGFRTAVFKAVPREIKLAISVGIGLFIALVGLVDAGIVRPGSPLVTLGVGGTLQGWPIFTFVFGLLLMIVLMVKQVRGAILISIVATTALAVVIELTAKVGGMFATDTPNPTGWMLNTPALSGSPVALPDFGLLGQFSLFGSIEKIGIVAVVLLVFSIMLADFFDTMGTMVAVGGEADLLDKDGNPPNTKQILIVDSVAAAAGGAASVSSNTSYIESAAGVGDGARTGLASVVTGIAFLLATFLAPLVNMVPSEAAAPALVVVGFLMFSQVTGIDWKNVEVAIPAFLVAVIMPFTYSIAAGIGAGFIAFVVIKVARGKAKEVHLLMWITSALFVVYFALGGIRAAFNI